MLKKLSTALALGLVVGLLSIPAASFAGKGPGDGTGDNLKCIGGIIVDGVCLCGDDVTMGPNGPKDGGVPLLECTHGEDSINPACLELDAITTEGNFDVAKQNRNDADPVCTGDCEDGPPWLLDAISTQGSFDVAAGQQNRNDADPDCDDPTGTPWWMNV